MNRREFLKVGGFGLGSLALAPLLDIVWPEGVTSKFEPLTAKIFGLTIDDGNSTETIENVLAECRNLGLRGTWFAHGSGLRMAGDSTDIFRMILQDGWTIGYHSLLHPPIEHTATMTTEQWIADYDRWNELAYETFPEDALFRSPLRRYARAPGGLFTPAFLEMCSTYDLAPYGWNKDPVEFSERPDTPLLESGDIWLLHFRHDAFEWLAKLAAAGFTAMNLDEMEDQVVYEKAWRGSYPECGGVDSSAPCIRTARRIPSDRKYDRRPIS